MPNIADIEIHHWNGPDDPENPYDYQNPRLDAYMHVTDEYQIQLEQEVQMASYSHRLLHVRTSTAYPIYSTLVVCNNVLTFENSSILTGLPAGTYGSGNDWMESEFHVQNSPFPNLYWATTSYNMGAAFWPLIFVPLTEASGRMPGYFVAYVILVISLFPSAFAKNFATLVVTRFFGGGASSVSINIVGGSISDIWLGDEARSLPMSIFGFTSVVGIALGPFIGSVIVQIPKSDPWRW